MLTEATVAEIGIMMSVNKFKYISISYQTHNEILYRDLYLLKPSLM